MTLLASLVHASQRVATTSARLAKVRELAAVLKQLTPDEIEIAVHYLSGEISQGRIGLGYSSVRAAMPAAAADTESLSLADVDRYLSSIEAIRGAGSQARRTAVLREMMSRATAAEQQFLLR